jgi:hypothetical protein
MERFAKKAALLALFPLRYYVYVTERPRDALASSSRTTPRLAGNGQL